MSALRTREATHTETHTEEKKRRIRSTFVARTYDDEHGFMDMEKRMGQGPELGNLPCACACSTLFTCSRLSLVCLFVFFSISFLAEYRQRHLSVRGCCLGKATMAMPPLNLDYLRSGMQFGEATMSATDPAGHARPQSIQHYHMHTKQIPCGYPILIITY